jgi:hypothetical protein
MNPLMLAPLALGLMASPPPQFTAPPQSPITGLNGSAWQTPLGNLTPEEQRRLLELERWLRTQQGIQPSETKAQCMDRLSSPRPTRLELALLDLKCSQRPTGRGE